MAVVSHVSPVLHIYELDTETKEEEKKPELVSATMDRIQFGVSACLLSVTQLLSNYTMDIC